MNSNSLSNTAETIFKKKYARKKSSGKLEEWEQCAARVGYYVATAEERGTDQIQYTSDFTKLIADRVFIPGGRVLANAGTTIKNLMNCFVMPIGDSRQSIYYTLQKAAEIFAWGGGIGYNFSDIRESGAKVNTTGGLASGPTSFMELFDTTGEVISQASRRGAQIGLLNVDHPDIVKFIRHKTNLTDRNVRIFSQILERCKFSDSDKLTVGRVLSENQLTHFNISVAVSNLFMNAVIQNSDWDLVSRLDGNIKSTVYAKRLFDEISINAWENGDPGIYFIDNANEFNLAPYLGSLNATNPCGEIPLLPWESCCLGSINLHQFVEDSYIDFDYLKFVVETSVRFLDNVQTLNYTPVSEINEATKLTRRLGLGVMGFADVLGEMNIPYNSEDAIHLAETLAKFIQETAWKYSMRLAEEKGAFSGFDSNLINWKIIDNLGLERKPVRNVAITSLAPTGTIAILADVNGSIEPFFARKYDRNVTSGIGNVAESVIQTSINFDNILTAHEIHWKDHVNMQAIWQKYTDNAVSKTINMPETISPDEIRDALIYAWEMKCKGITVYRDNSKGFQILNAN